MDSTKMIADLCAVIDRMNVIIQAQAMELAQYGAVVHAEEIAEVRQKYARAIGEGGTMSLEEILLGGGGVLLAAMTLIQVAPIKVNPWSAVAKAIGRAINGEVIAKVDQLERDLVAMKAAQEERDAISCRSRILHFGDETIHGVRHTKEHFDQILRDITSYEQYCENHPHFENNTTVLTSRRIKDIYEECMATADFL